MPPTPDRAHAARSIMRPRRSDPRPTHIRALSSHGAVVVMCVSLIDGPINSRPELGARASYYRFIVYVSDSLLIESNLRGLLSHKYLILRAPLPHGQMPMMSEVSIRSVRERADNFSRLVRHVLSAHPPIAMHGTLGGAESIRLSLGVSYIAYDG